MVVHDAVLVGLPILEHIHHVTSFAKDVLQYFDLPLLRCLLVLTVVQFLSFLESLFNSEFSVCVDRALRKMILIRRIESIASTVLHL